MVARSLRTSFIYSIRFLFYVILLSFTEKPQIGMCLISVCKYVCMYICVYVHPRCLHFCKCANFTLLVCQRVLNKVRAKFAACSFFFIRPIKWLAVLSLQFQMTVEWNYAIAIIRLSDLLKILASVF